MKSSRGFTLLEVLIAMAILAIAATTLIGAQSRSVVQNDHARHLSVAAMLGHDQMYAIETRLRKDGFQKNEERDRGQFHGREYADYRWESLIEPIDLDPETLSSELQGQLLGTDKDQGTLSGSTAITSQLPTMLGMVTMMIQNITDNRVRKVTLAIEWKDLKGEHTFTLEQFIVLMEAPEGGDTLQNGTVDHTSSIGSSSSGSSSSGSSSSGSSGGSK